MANKKISELNELTAAIANDLIPIVDTISTETKKIRVSNLLSTLVVDKNTVGLANVDNTSDANKPVSNATQLALNLKEDLSNKSTATSLGTSDVLYPSQNAVKTYVDSSIQVAQANRIAKKITSTQSTTSNSASNISGADLSVTAGETWIFDITLQIGCDAAGGVKLALTFPVGASVRAIALGTSTGDLEQLSQLISSSGVLTTQAFNTLNSQDGFVRVTGTIINPTNSGTLQVQYASDTAGQQSTIYEHSVVLAHKVT